MAKKKSDYPVDEYKISSAMQRGEYLLESASLPVVLMGDVAERLYNHKPLHDLDKVEFAIRKSALSRYALSTLKTMVGEKWTKTKHEGIDIKFNVINQDRGFLERPDQASFWGGVYKIPNPFKKYWKMRGLVK